MEVTWVYEMRGTPEEVRRGLDALTEKYGSDRYQREAS